MKRLVKISTYPLLYICMAFFISSCTEESASELEIQEEASMEGENNSGQEPTYVQSPSNGQTNSQPAAQQTTNSPEKKRMSNTAKGALIGAGAGAITGAVVSKKKGKGAIVGGVIGAGAGAIAGKVVDKRQENDVE
ncbi:MAG: glycine zipper 2TM domain-containing protein [Bacteroidetes bacterium]|nr:glycine zipper 2TM domain-containing protein [Bacteroidota bacterium]